MTIVRQFLYPLFRQFPVPALVSSLLLAAFTMSGASAQDTVEWTTLGNDFAHTRYSPADQITAENFSELEVAWQWDGSSFQAQSGRSTPSYIDGRKSVV